MKKYAKVINSLTKECSVGEGTDTAYYEANNFKLVDVEQAYNDKWYLMGYAPKKPDNVLIEETDLIIKDLLESYDWRITRYQEQKLLNIPTSDSDEEIKNICSYKQYLRDLDKDKDYPYIDILSYEEYISMK